jgi:phosphoesterase RecJ-like protein
LYQKAWDLIDSSHYITLISHINPDGDTLGGALSLYPRLKSMGKKVSLFNNTKQIARKYDFLPNFSKIKNDFPKNCDLLISSDCGSFDRLGIDKGDFKIINIDHHKSNTNFGDINIIDETYASSTLLSKELLEHKYTLTKDEAICIYTGLVEDTGFFTFNNTDDKSFLIASQLVNLGVNPSEISQKLKMRNSLAKTRLTALFIDSIELIEDAKIAVGKVTQDDIKKTGAKRSDSDHLVDILRNLSTVKLAVFIFELEDKTFKVSLRSKKDIDVSIVAQSFGGGGHRNAAGFEYKGNDINILIQKIKKEIALS